MRGDGRDIGALRPLSIEVDYTENPLASVLVSMGRTRVLCTLHCEDSVPRFLQGMWTGMGDRRVFSIAGLNAHTQHARSCPWKAKWSYAGDPTAYWS